MKHFLTAVLLKEENFGTILSSQNFSYFPKGFTPKVIFSMRYLTKLFDVFEGAGIAFICLMGKMFSGK